MYNTIFLWRLHSNIPPIIPWLCGNRQLHSTLPSNWKGTCARVALAQKTSIISDRDLETLIDMQETNAISHTRLKRSTQLTRFKDDPRVWIDEIGVPRGVPNENKAQNQISAGLLSAPCPWCININVDWINYIYYNQQRFSNYTFD